MNHNIYNASSGISIKHIRSEQFYRKVRSCTSTHQFANLYFRRHFGEQVEKYYESIFFRILFGLWNCVIFWRKKNIYIEFFLKNSALTNISKICSKNFLRFFYLLFFSKFSWVKFNACFHLKISQNVSINLSTTFCTVSLTLLVIYREIFWVRQPTLLANLPYSTLEVIYQLEKCYRDFVYSFRKKNLCLKQQEFMNTKYKKIKYHKMGRKKIIQIERIRTHVNWIICTF